MFDELLCICSGSAQFKDINPRFDFMEHQTFPVSAVRLTKVISQNKTVIH